LLQKASVHWNAGFNRLPVLRALLGTSFSLHSMTNKKHVSKIVLTTKKLWSNFEVKMDTFFTDLDNRRFENAV
jgi:hypothetical protein